MNQPPVQPGASQLNVSAVTLSKKCVVPPEKPYDASLTRFLPNVERSAPVQEYRCDH